MIKIKTICLFCAIFTSVLLIKDTLAKPIDDNKIKNTTQAFGDVAGKIHLTDHNFTEYYANRAANASRQILKDPTVIANQNEEVEKFKLNLTSILNNYDEIKKDADINPEMKDSNMAYNELLNQFLNITGYYIEVPEEKATTDTKFIVDVLKKYDGYKIYVELKSLGEVLGHIVARVLAEIFFG